MGKKKQNTYCKQGWVEAEHSGSFPKRKLQKMGEHSDLPSLSSSPLIRDLWAPQTGSRWTWWWWVLQNSNFCSLFSPLLPTFFLLSLSSSFFFMSVPSSPGIGLCSGSRLQCLALVQVRSQVGSVFQDPYRLLSKYPLLWHSGWWYQPGVPGCKARLLRTCG